MSLAEYMAHLRSRPAVKVMLVCSCGGQKTLEELYFCGSNGEGKVACLKLVCSECVTKEIDTFFCPSCLNSVFSAKAFEGRNRCRQCAMCPGCSQTLQVVAAENDVHHFKCEYCKWSSEVIDLVGPSSSSLVERLLAREEKGDVALEFQRLLRHYRNPKAREDVVDGHTKREYPNAVAATRELDEYLAIKNATPRPTPASNPLEVIGSDELVASSTIQQRLAHPDSAAMDGEQMWPVRVPLWTKLSCRCPGCKQFVIKPKAGANKTQFDVHQIALALLPRITVADLPTWKVGATSKFTVFFKNSLESPAELRLSPIEPKHEADDRGHEHKEAQASISSTPVSLGAYDELAEQSSPDKPSIQPSTTIEVCPTHRGPVTVSCAVLLTPTKATCFDHFSYQLCFSLGHAE